MNDNDIKAIEQEANKLQAKMKAMVQPLQDQIDELDIKLQKQPGYVSNSTESPVFNQVHRVVKNATWLTDVKNTKRGGVLDFTGIDLLTKVGTVTRVADTIQPQFTQFQYVPGRRTHLRDLLPVGTATSSQIWMPYEAATTNAIARVAEGGLKPQSDFTPSVVKWDIEKLATYITFTTELLEDFPQLTSYLTTRWIELLKQLEDTKLLYGTGSSDIKGLTVSGSAWVDNLADSKVDYYMILDSATTQVQNANFVPNYILLNPTDAMKLRQTRDTTGAPYFLEIGMGQPMMINGATIIPTPAVTVGDFITGDFNNGAMLWDRRSANITFYDQHSDDAIYNRVTAVLEERICLTTYNSTAFCFGNFVAALAKGSA